jgi:hypothetical protein
MMVGPGEIVQKEFLGRPRLLGLRVSDSEGKDICRLSGVEFIVMTIPTPAMLEPSPSVHGKSVDEEYPDRMIRSISEKLKTFAESVLDLRVGRQNILPAQMVSQVRKLYAIVCNYRG